MFKLHEKLETKVEINGITYEVNLSFDNVLVLLELMKDPKLNDSEKVYYGIYLLLGTELEFEMDKLVIIFEKLLTNFIHTEEEQEQIIDLEGNIMPVADKPQVYDLIHDATFIYTSFKQAYGINLIEEQGKLDWREFKLLLRDLPEDTKLKQVIDIRMRPYPKGKGMSEERRKLKELKRTFALPGTKLDD